MRIFLISLSLLFLASITSATNCHSEEVYKHEDMSITSGEITKNIIDINVNGMVCDFCAQSIEKVFMKRDEVKGINVNLEKQKVIIYLKKETNITNDIIGTLFEGAGYSIKK
ncbi:heavy-metal-associated domain-containing protein [Alphaproteobacteria bacterium]|nr:heavy-metal-associated domain-containing protein [Alphaproteobacteria bacterium]